MTLNDSDTIEKEFVQRVDSMTEMVQKFKYDRWYNLHNSVSMVTMSFTLVPLRTCGGSLLTGIKYKVSRVMTKSVTWKNLLLPDSVANFTVRCRFQHGSTMCSFLSRPVLISLLIS